jgi:6-phosphogluconolactonase (cycloisomerase 2 family)
MRIEMGNPPQEFQKFILERFCPSRHFAGAMNISIYRTLVGALSLIAGFGSAQAQVYTQTNESGMNRIAEFRYNADGTLRAPRFFATGGAGTGSGLGVQGAVAVTDDDQYLYAVNAASNDISTFLLGPNGPFLIDRTPSGGAGPVSLSTRGSLLYVVNTGGDSHINGFRIGDFGRLTAIPGAIQSLSAMDAAPGRIAINPEGDTVVVSEKNTNRLSYFPIGTNGGAYDARFVDSAGMTPFGFDFARRGKLLVTEAAGGTAGGSTVSSYVLADDGKPWLRSSRVPTFQTAACWLSVSPTGRLAYSANTPNNNISGFRVNTDGSIRLLDPSGVTATFEAGSSPSDMAFRKNGRMLYVLETGRGFVSTFAIDGEGGLTKVSESGGLPSATGLAVR